MTAKSVLMRSQGPGARAPTCPLATPLLFRPLSSTSSGIERTECGICV